MDKKYTISFAYTILFALVMAVAMNQNQQALAQNQTYQSYYPHILDYCFNRTEKILSGYNPLSDLVKADLIPRHFENMTCGDVSDAWGNSTSAFSKPEH